ncbi:N-acetylneuraminate synthase [Devosia oryziradicis]|uniref:N-acetylneuraminate synthase n=1 Tax=Devosia oryziradicis TaxID=2801335 RepID=A0ABX7BTU9_9HYPH|nr:N-acetylneuraminate synthase [Devosia oryziradicis]QQR35347.1 N-acetylneuraminate synthase [Devosia oryziradicis]
MSTFIIAEAGVNHDGDSEQAMRLVEVAAQSGADAVKFQTFSADKLTRKGAEKAEYQKKMTGDGDQHAMLAKLEMSHELHEALVRRSAELGIEFMSTAFDEDALDFLVSMGIRRIKVPSGEITNLPFLAHMASKNLPMIVSTGMADMGEVKQAVAAIAAERSRNGFSAPLEEIVTILHCTSNYPAAASDVNLRAMLSMAEEIGMPIGYSDHTLGIAISTAAVAMGATVIEKHFTLDKTLPGPDHAASLEPDELKALIKAIRDVESARGDGIKAPTASELPVRALVRRSVTTLRDIAAGASIGPEDVALLRPGTGIPPAEFQNVLGKRARHPIAAGQTVQWTDLQ